MKQPSIPLTIAYKVVQVDAQGRMWSINLSLNSSLSKNMPADQYSDRLLRYQLRHQVLPNTQVPYLFVCPTKADAVEACGYYNTRKNKYVLRGYAANLQVIKYATDLEILGSPVRDIVPHGFTSALCSWFIPIGVVHKVKGRNET